MLADESKEVRVSEGLFVKPSSDYRGCVRRGTEDRTRVFDSLFEDRKSTRLNSSHVSISYAVFCLKKKKRFLFYFLIVYIRPPPPPTFQRPRPQLLVPPLPNHIRILHNTSPLVLLLTRTSLFYTLS